MSASIYNAGKAVSRAQSLRKRITGAPLPELKSRRAISLHAESPSAAVAGGVSTRSSERYRKAQLGITIGNIDTSIDGAISFEHIIFLGDVNRVDKINRLSLTCVVQYRRIINDPRRHNDPYHDQHNDKFQ